MLKNPTYSFIDVNATLTGPGASLLLSESGVADEGIDFQYSGEKSSMMTGASGDGMHSLHAGQPGRVVLRLLKVSPLNAALSKLYAAQTASPALHGRNTITLSDAQRGDFATAEQCAFSKHTDGKWAKEGNIQEWVFDSTRITTLLGSGQPAA